MQSLLLSLEHIRITEEKNADPCDRVGRRYSAMQINCVNVSAERRHRNVMCDYEAVAAYP